MKIIGKQKVQGVSKSTGNPYQGITVFCSYESQNIEGVGTDKTYIGSNCTGYSDLVDAPIGAEVKYSYNRWGNVDVVQIL